MRKECTNNMKTKYLPITPKEGLSALEANEGRPVEGYAFKESYGKTWTHDALHHVVGQTSHPFVSNDLRVGWQECAKVIHTE